MTTRDGGRIEVRLLADGYDTISNSTSRVIPAGVIWSQKLDSTEVRDEYLRGSMERGLVGPNSDIVSRDERIKSAISLVYQRLKDAEATYLDHL